MAEGRPIVALESAVITHGLPRPINLELARRMEAEVRKAAAVPAIAAVLDGVAKLGLAPEELERLSLDVQAVKISRRDFGWARAAGRSGGTTVAGAMIMARAAGVPIFATGGIGGVHRGGGMDVSADLPELAQTPVAVVCSGAKAILDLPRTIEWLETAGVPVIGYQTEEFPGFYSRNSGLPVSARADSPADVARILRTHWELPSAGGLLIGVPCPESDAIPPEELQEALRQAETEARNVSGAALTPFLLSRMSEFTGGRSLGANLALLRNNAQVAAKIAVAMA
ncbi:MAG: pseudouridine-5'-phosphate glycosidase [Anaerolineae bacterium]|nr:MAG: pseudouridine-5'-phosphate glycosidase [Anaerolineae bacterium]